jgi:two-component system sensor histidine kinase KdpD
MWNRMKTATAAARSPTRLLAGVAAPAAATAVGLGLGSGRTTAAALVYLLGVVATAWAAGLAAGVVASLLSFLGLNFFFTPPRHTFSVAKPDDLVALVGFLVVGVVVSSLVAVALAQRARAERRELEARTLHAVASRLASADGLEGALADLAEAARQLFGLARAEVRIREPDGALVSRAVAGGAGAGEGAAGDGDPAGDGGAAAGQGAMTFPLEAGGTSRGELVLVPGPAGFGEAERRVAGILARQTAVALERSALEREAAEARVAAEAGRVRRALLSAVSHDFRTPLASIKASLSALAADAGRSLDPGQAGELVRTALEETERLERLVANLLDLGRVRSGALLPERVPVPVEEVLEDALAGTRTALARHRVEVFLRPDVPLALVDPVQVAHVFRNVLDNAAKYAPPGTTVRIAAARWQDGIEVRISDRGPGIPPDEREAVFEEFYRAGDTRAAGTGLGLALARAFVTANGGRIWVEETPGGGATVVVRLPAAEAA